MARYTQNGGVVSSKLPSRSRSTGHRSMFGIYRGIVLQSVYPEDPKNITGNRMEYKIRVRGQDYPNAINMRDAGGIYNYAERVRKGVEKSLSGNVDDAQYNENLDGEHVWVMFAEGNGDIPVIVGADNHNLVYKKLSKADGLVDVEEFNGIEWRVDKAGNFSITIVGLKDVDGAVKNSAAVGTIIKLGTDGSALIKALGNMIRLDSAGTEIDDKNGNKVSMASAGITVTVAGDVTVNASGKATIKSGGALAIDAGGPITIKAAGDSFNGGLVTDNAINNDPITGIPLSPVGGTTTQ